MLDQILKTYKLKEFINETFDYNNIREKKNLPNQMDSKIE